MSRVFSSVDETSSMMTNLFLSLTRADQDDWLAKMGLARESEGGLASSASMRGFSNMNAIVSAAKGTSSLNVAAGSSTNVIAGTGRSAKFDLGSPRVSAALRLVGEDHKPEDETAKPRTIDVSRAGAAGKTGHMRGWFNDAAGYTEMLEADAKFAAQQEAEEQEQQEQDGAGGSAGLSGSSSPSALQAAAEEARAAKHPEPTLLTIDRARKEWLEQDHMGAPNPEGVFNSLLDKYPKARVRGGITFDEFVAIFSRFEYF